MTARDKLSGIKADYWDCQEAEVLTFVDPISALEGCVENHLDRGCRVEDVIREMGTIEVSAYRRKTITEETIRDLADTLLDQVVEDLDEDGDYGDPDGDHPLFSLDVLAQHRPAFETVVRDLCARAKVWQCESFHTVELTPDEAIEILRVERPEWFELPADDRDALAHSVIA